MKVKIDVYNHFKMADSFFHEWDTDVPSMRTYAQLVKERAYYPYDTIDIDSGRILIIPITDNKLFLMSRNVTLFKESGINIYTDFYINEDSKVTDLINEDGDIQVQ